MTSARLLVFVALFITVYVVSCRGMPPHIVFIVADDLGWNDVGWHNPDMITPNLDKLAKQGVILNSSYVQYVCTPSRNCFMTGYYPYHTGLQHDVIHPLLPSFLPKDIVILPQKLKEVGYTTHIVGKGEHNEDKAIRREAALRQFESDIRILKNKARRWHLGFCNWSYTPTYRGFDSFTGYYTGAEDYYTHIRDDGYDFRKNTEVYYQKKGEYSANIFAETAIDIISSINSTTQPMYLYLPFQSVHAPLEVPKKYEDMYSHIKTKQRRLYCGMVSALDEAVGNITKALDDHGFMDNLLLVFTTDNGGPIPWGANNWPLRGSKHTLWEGGTKGAAFVFSKTLLKKSAYEHTGMIHAVDWFPTLLHVAGGKTDTNIDGLNVWKTISENDTSPRTEFVYNIDEILQNAAIRVGDYKLIEGDPESPSGWYPPPDFIEEPTLTFQSTYKLFNIKEDPTEHYDLSKTHTKKLKELQERLEVYKKSLVKANYPPPSPAGDPKNFNGTWSPGWC